MSDSGRNARQGPKPSEAPAEEVKKADAGDSGAVEGNDSEDASEEDDEIAAIADVDIGDDDADDDTKDDDTTLLDADNDDDSDVSDLVAAVPDDDKNV